jgi:menaquinol-cytochrome c reductase iron-sulfur subunit
MTDQGGTEELSRRTFFLRALTGIGAAFTAAVAIPVIGFGSAPFWRSKAPISLLSHAVTPALRASGWASAGNLDDFKVGEPRLITLSRDIVDGWVKGQEEVACFVLRTGDSDAIAFDHHCTHLGCPLAWSGGAKRFLCPCHGGGFDATGKVVAGPPPRPMLTYATRIESGEIMVGSLEQGA